MSATLVTTEPLRHLDSEFITRLSMETGRLPAWWEKALAVPSLGRALFSCESVDEAEDWARRLRAAGLPCGTLSLSAAQRELRRAPTAERIERRGDEIGLVLPDGTEVVLSARVVTHLVIGTQPAPDGGRFIVIGVEQEPVALVLRSPGTSYDELGADLDAVFAWLSAWAPRAVIEQALNDAEVPLGLPPEVGSDDRAHIAVLSCCITRRAAHATTLTDMRSPIAQRGAMDAAIADAADAVADDAPTVPNRQLGGSVLVAAVTHRIAPVAAAAIALVCAIVVLSWPHAPPESAAHELAVGERWQSPFGVSFLLRHARDASVGMVSRAELVLDIRRGEAVDTVAIGRALRADHVAFGVRFTVVRPAQLAPVRHVRIEVGGQVTDAGPLAAAAVAARPLSAEPAPPPDAPFEMGVSPGLVPPSSRPVPPPPPLQVEAPPPTEPATVAAQRDTKAKPIKLTRERPAKKKKRR